MHVAQLNYRFDASIADPDALVDRYSTLTGWSEAVLGAGAERVSVVQRFSRDARIVRNGIEYLFRRGGSLDGPSPWTRLRHVHDAVASLSPDVVHVNGLVFPVQTWRLRRILPRSAAIVVQDHASRAPAPGATTTGVSIRRRLHARCLGVADGFLFSAQEHADEWRRAGLISPRQPAYQVMESSTTFRAVSQVAARKAGGIVGTPALLWVGRLNANKDPLTVLDGFERCLPLLPGAVLSMIHGADDLLPAVRDRVAQSPALQQRVHLLGRVPHDAMPMFYTAADVFVLGSHHEGSGYAVLEACACGAVPVVTDIPTFRAMCGNGSLGSLWRAGDPRSFADALVDIGRRDLPRDRARVVDHFDRALSWRVVGRQAFEAYTDLLARRGAAAREGRTR